MIIYPGDNLNLKQSCQAIISGTKARTQSMTVNGDCASLSMGGGAAGRVIVDFLNSAMPEPTDQDKVYANHTDPK